MRGRVNLALGALSAGMFVLGSGELLVAPGGQLASSLPASAANVGIALGSYAGGVAIGAFDASSTVITGLVIALIAVVAAWATSCLKPIV